MWQTKLLEKEVLWDFLILSRKERGKCRREVKLEYHNIQI